MSTAREVLRDLGLLLTFRLPEERWDQLGSRHLVLGLAFTWLAGVGRHWDAPRAEWWQFAGLGSLAYVLVLTAILGLVLWPLVAPGHFEFRRLLTFICLTSPPALLYAIPVEQFLALAAATKANVWFLAIVALWRVALLGFYLHRGFRLDGFRCAVGVLLPISAIIFALVALNLDHVVFRLMGGLRDDERSSSDGAYAVLFLFQICAAPVFLGSVLVWLGMLGARVWRVFRKAANDSAQ